MARKNISKDKIVQSFLFSAFDKSAGATSLADISSALEIKKASLYNHFANRDSMYSATLEFCRKEILDVNFITENTAAAIRKENSNPMSVAKHLVTRYFNLFESEPLFQMYVFVHTEQYFNPNALDTVSAAAAKLSDEIAILLRMFAEAGKIPPAAEEKIAHTASGTAAVIIQQLDLYIAGRKETMRQNPESGAGSLFALPTDENALNTTLGLLENILQSAAGL